VLEKEGTYLCVEHLIVVDPAVLVIVLLHQVYSLLLMIDGAYPRPLGCLGVPLERGHDHRVILGDIGNPDNQSI
jgi:hypothetical protein